jgi:acetyl/propionyl-CoA carboxylase alpha subunit
MKKSNSALKKVLIANRGEIACRIISACRSAGMKTVAVYSQADKGALHTRLADEAVEIGPGPATESYLNVEKLIEACKRTGADAVHPGYGFLSERSHFANAVQKAGLTWIGPDPKVIDLMGNKVAAKKAAESAKVPTLPWALLGEGWGSNDLKSAGKKVGFPLLLKAAAGGGGRGMRLVEKESELEEKAESAVREAQGAFGSSEIFLEKYCAASRHIEVQVIGDSHGTVVALGERECSAQRRHQKVIEEAPAPNLSDATRKALWTAAVNLAKAVNYVNAGTCEFLVDAKENFFFLEMNTRLQVEHPVTELVWGVDLPALQLRVAQGEPLPAEVEKRVPRGHAIEARIYAEDPSKGFMPSPGKLLHFHVPNLPFLRIDAGYETGSEVPLYYDAMLAKVIAWGMDREQARQTLARALDGSTISGVAWNGRYLADVLRHKRFIQGKVDTQFLETDFSGWKGEVRTDQPASSAAQQSSPSREQNTQLSPWLVYGTGGAGLRTKSGRSATAHDAVDFSSSNALDGAPLVAEYPGKVLKVLVKAGQTVDKGQVVVVCESMKMEFTYSALSATKVKNVLVQPGQVIPAGTTLIEWEETAKQ